jgi:ribosome production factor 2
MLYLQGRTFDGHILDMFEFGVDQYQSIDFFSGMKKTFGSKPLLVFLGKQWSSDALYTRIENYFIDFFRGTKFDMISLAGIDNVLVFSVVDSKIYIRGYAVSFKKSGTKVCFNIT